MKPLILEFSEYDLNNVVSDIEEIRRYNPQRYEMEHWPYLDSGRGEPRPPEAKALQIPAFERCRHGSTSHPPGRPGGTSGEMHAATDRTCDYLSAPADRLGACPGRRASSLPATSSPGLRPPRWRCPTPTRRTPGPV